MSKEEEIKAYRELPLIEKHKLKCKHFTGTVNKVCRAGVKYDDLDGLPCMLSPYNEDTNSCPLRQFPMQEEAEAWAAKVRQSGINRSIAREAIIADIGPERMNQGIGGTIPCPICKTGTVHYSRAGSYNGHVHAACTTEGCVRWME